MKLIRILFPVLLLLLTLISACKHGEEKVPPTCDSMQCPQGCKNGQCVEFECTQTDTTKCSDKENCVAGVCLPIQPGGCTVTCSRGVCDPTTDQCVNDLCTTLTENKRCLENHVCVNNTCVKETEICATLDCDSNRGVCDPEKRACVNTPDGTCHDSKKCQTGYYCDTTTNSCKHNNCQPDGTCARGVCNVETGQCENTSPGTCKTSRKCKDGYECLADGNCVKAEEVCGPTCIQGKTLKQCTYDPTTLTGICTTTTCQSSIDCNASEVCNLKTHPTACVPAPTCEPAGQSSSRKLTGTREFLKEDLCDGATDTYSYLPEKIGVLVVQVVRPKGEVGFGKFILKIKDPTGSVVANVATDDAAQSIDHLVANADVVAGPGRWTVELTAEGLTSKDPSKTSMAHYDIRFSVVPKEVEAVCNGARPLTFGRTHTSNAVVRGKRNIKTKTNNCTFSGDGAFTEAWSFHLDKESYVEFAATPNPYMDIALSLRKDCMVVSSEPDNFCTNTTVANEPEILSGVLPPGNYTLVVSTDYFNHASAPEKAIYRLLAAKSERICTPGVQKGECSPTKKGEVVCNEHGTDWIDVPCPKKSAGCSLANGMCEPIAADTCATAIEVTENSPVSEWIDLNPYSNAYDHAATCSTSGSVQTISSAKTKGHDVVYKVTVPPNKFLFADAQTEDDSSTAIYVVEDCTALDTCVASAEFARPNRQVSVFHQNTGNTPLELYVIVDSQAPNAGTYDTNRKLRVNISVGDQVCQPHSYKCQKSDTVSIRCNATGSEYLNGQEIQCMNGCESSPAATRPGQCRAERGDACNYAKSVGVGSPVRDSITKYMHTSKPPGMCGHIEYNTRGGSDSPLAADAFYTVETTQPDQVITFTVTPDPANQLLSNAIDPMIWLVQACEEGIAVGCLDAVDDHTGETESETLQVEARTPGTYIFGVSNGPSSAPSVRLSGDYDVNVNIEPMNPARNTIIGCDASSSDILLYRDEYGRQRAYTCPNGCDKTSNRCIDGTGATCNEVVLLDRNDLLRSPTAPNKTFEKEAAYPGRTPFPRREKGIYGQCIDNVYWGTPPGADNYHMQVNLEPGDLLVVTPVDPVIVDTSTRQSSEQFRITTECGHDEACVAYMDNGHGRVGDKILKYRASKAGPVYIHVEADRIVGNWPGWKMKAYIEPNKQCVPNQYACTSDTDLGLCGDGSTPPKTYTCQNGCAAGTCQVDAASTSSCGAAPTLTPDIPYYFDLSNGAPEGPPSCVKANSSLNKTQYFKVVANPTDVIEVSVQNLGSRTVPVVFIAKDDCSDLNTACLDGISGNSTALNGVNAVAIADAEIPANATPGASYLIGVTGEDPTLTKYVITTRVKPRECTPTPGQSRCSSEAGYSELCPKGLWRKYPCSSGTCDASTGGCTAPTGDTCIEPEPLDTTTKGTLKQTSATDWTNRTNGISYKRTSDSTCVARDSNEAGADRIFSVDLEAGETFEAWITPYDPSMIFLYLTDSCLEHYKCLSSVTVGELTDPYGASQKLLYYAEKAGTYYLVLDNHTSFHKSNKQSVVNYKITPKTAGSCVPGTRRCSGDSSFELCNNSGTYDRFNCLDDSAITQTCYNGYCIVPTSADRCESAPTLTTEFRGIYNNALYTNQHNVSDTTQCGISQNTPGNDIFFKVDLAANEQVVVTFEKDSASSEFPNVYFFKDCTHIDKTCLPHYDSFVGTNRYRMTYKYSTTKAETVYIALDQRTSNTVMPFEIKVEHTPECTNTTPFMCDPADEYNILYCDASGFFRPHRCENSKCAAGRCNNTFGRGCLEAKQLTYTTSGKTKTASDRFYLREGNFIDLKTNNSCTGVSTNGRDVTVEIELEAGEVLTATASVNPSPPNPITDISLYLVNSCYAPEFSCLAGSDKPVSAQPEVLTYRASGKERLYLVVDSHENGGLYADVNLSVEITSP